MTGSGNFMARPDTPSAPGRRMPNAPMQVALLASVQVGACSRPVCKPSPRQTNSVNAPDQDARRK
jgi:hypothetical protein